MNVPSFAHLDEKDTTAKVIDYLLPALGIPPLDRIVGLPTGDDDPERHHFTGDFLHLRHPGFLLRGEVNIAFEKGWLDLDSQLPAEVIDEPLDEMQRAVITIVN